MVATATNPLAEQSSGTDLQFCDIFANPCQSFQELTLTIRVSDQFRIPDELRVPDQFDRRSY